MGGRWSYNFQACPHKMMSESIDFRKRKLVFVDIETTGLDPEIHEIIEISCLIVDGETFEEVGGFTEKIVPERIGLADPNAISISGYTQEGWQNARSLQEVIQKFAGTVPGGIITGWNVAFDWSFLEHALKRLNINSDFDYHRLDVMSIAYGKLFPDLEVTELGLRKIAPKLGIEIDEKHGAEKDIRATYEVFKKLMR